MTTCEDVRPLLAEHLLVSLEDPDELEVRRHLRGCAACRRDLDALREGLSVFGSTLERPAPRELRDRVVGALSEEWTEPDHPEPRHRATRGWLAAASVVAAVTVAIAAVAFGVVQMGHAREAELDAGRYGSILATLGGTGFRAGTLRPAGTTPVQGSVLAYESSHEQSFVLVFVRVDDVDGTGTMVVARSDGTTWQPASIRFDGNGDAATWWVARDGISSMTRVTVVAPDGSALATARIRAV